MGMNAFGEKKQEKELTSPALKSLRDAVASMTPHPTLAARFYNPFVTKLHQFVTVQAGVP
jgi:hypothetical protein